MSVGNCFFYLTGNASEKDIDLLCDCVSALNIPKAAVINDNVAPTPKDFGKRILDVAIKGGDWCHINFSFDVDNTLCPISVMDIFYYVLFYGDDALFYNELSEENPLIYSYDSRTEQYRNISRMKLSFEVSKRNVATAIKKTVEVFNCLKTGDFNFENGMKKINAKYQFTLDNPSDLNWTMAYENHILGGERIDYTKEKLGKYDGITKQQVADCARKVFTCNNLVFCIKSNKKQIKTNKNRRTKECFKRFGIKKEPVLMDRFFSTL